MRDNGEEIERLLTQVPVPSLREGTHREQLKGRLLHPTEPSQRNGEETMRERKEKITVNSARIKR